MYLTAEFRIIRKPGIRLVEEPETEFHTENAAYGIIDSRHLYCTFLNQSLEIDSELAVIWHHSHVYTCIDSKPYRFLLSFSDLLACMKIGDVRPVCDYDSIPIEIFLEPYGKKFMIAMERDSVVACRIDHEAESARLDTFLERFEILFAHLRSRDGRRRTVLSRHRNSVSKIMLETCRYMLRTDMIRIVTLHAPCRRYRKFSIEISIFTEAFPHTWPLRIPSEVHSRREGPRHIGSAALICRDLSHVVRKLAVERRGKAEFLWEKRTTRDIGSTMNVIQTVQARDTGSFH